MSVGQFLNPEKPTSFPPNIKVVLAVASMQQLDEFHLSTPSGHTSVLISFLSHLMGMLLADSIIWNLSMNLFLYVTPSLLPMDQGVGKSRTVLF